MHSSRGQNMKKPSVLYLSSRSLYVAEPNIVSASCLNEYEAEKADLVVYGEDYMSSKAPKAKEDVSFSNAINANVNLRHMSPKRCLEIYLQFKTKTYEPKFLSGKSSQIKELNSKILRVNKAKCPIVLITGEAGTGKEIVARSLLSEGENCIELNCAAIPEELLESELFGYEAGAFTGATRAKAGLIELASHGVLFLDEIAELSTKLQAKLLRVIEYKSFKRLGSTKNMEFRGRIVAATNKDLKEMIKKGSFREDLFYRLSAINLSIPALRYRKSDLALLFEEINFSKYLQHKEALYKEFDDEFLEYLERQDWNGNIRELKNKIESYYVFYPDHTNFKLNCIQLEEGRPSEQAFELPSGGLNFMELERSLLISALQRSKGNKTKASKLLGLSRHCFRYRLQKHDIVDHR